MKFVQSYFSLASICFLAYMRKSSAILTSNYTTELINYIPGSLSAWYSMTNGFISSVYVDAEGALDIVEEELRKKDFEIPDSLYPMLKAQAGVIVCFVFGILFVIVMWLAGILFCCCRFRGVCAGYKKRFEGIGKYFKHMVLIILLAGFIIMLMPASIILFAINDSLTVSLQKTERAILHSLTDAEVFLNSTQHEIHSAVVNGLEYAVKGITGDIDNIKNITDKKMEEPLSKLGLSVNQTERALLGWLKLSNTLDKSYSLGNEIKQKLIMIRSLLNDTKNKVIAFKQTCTDSDCQKINVSAFNADIVPDLDTNPLKRAKDQLSRLNKQTYKNMNDQIKNALAAIPRDLSTKTLALQDEAKKKLKDYVDYALNSIFLKNLKNFTRIAGNGLRDGREEASHTLDTTKSFDKTRWSIGIFVSMLVLIVLLGLIFGFTAGMLGTYFPLLPRDLLKKGAGSLLLFVVYWIFVFSSALMLITTFLFVTGGITEMYICRPMFDEKFVVLDKLVMIVRNQTKVIPQGDEYKVVRSLLPSFVLRSCMENKTAYVALTLRQLNLKSMLDYKKFVDMEKHFKQFSSIVPPTVNLPSAGIQEFSDLKNALNFSIPRSIFQTLDKDGPDFSKQRKVISNFPKTNNILDNLAKIEKIVKETDEKKKAMKKSLQEVVKDAKDSMDSSDKLVKDINNFNRNSGNLIPKVITETVDILSKGIADHCDQLINDIEGNLEKDVARCRIVWNIFDSARTVLCKYYVLPLNGIWFAIGWSLFLFVPLIYICTKLSDNFHSSSSSTINQRVENTD